MLIQVKINPNDIHWQFSQNTENIYTKLNCSIQIGLLQSSHLTNITTVFGRRWMWSASDGLNVNTAGGLTLD